jgi:hypothetical protein
VDRGSGNSMKLREAMKSATPGPYILGVGTPPDRQFVTVPDGHCLAECNHDGVGKPETHAALICHWMNHGPELLEALEGVLTDGLEDVIETGIGVFTETSKAAKRAVATIAKCEEVEGL